MLNANYVRARLAEHYEVAYGNQICMHEVVLSANRQKQQNGVRALDISKRLMDYGYHPPTNYFPLIVPEALMIEPTETESKQTLDEFIDAMIQIAQEAQRESRNRQVRAASYGGFATGRNGGGEEPRPAL